MPNIIQFGELEEMIPDLEPQLPVRISTVTMLLSTIQDLPNAGVFQLCVTVRQIIANDIFSWLIPLAEFDTANGRAISDSDIATMEDGVKQARLIIERIEERLLAQDENFDIKPGVIEIGVMPIHGTWAYLELEEVLVDGTSNQDGDNNSDDERQTRSGEDDDDIPF